MAGDADNLAAVKRVFAQTIELKLTQFYSVVPKGSNADLTGKFVEEIVRGFIQQWIAPCRLAHGTLHPHDAATNLRPKQLGPKQIDGIVYDPRLGPAIIREGDFLITHPAFCRGIIEIKTSTNDVKQFEEDLKLRYDQYLAPAWEDGKESLWESHVMGIVIQDSKPAQRRGPDWMGDTPLYDYLLLGHCPIFILFKEQDGSYEPYEPAIDAMIKAIYQSNWHAALLGPRIQGGPLAS